MLSLKLFPSEFFVLIDYLRYKLHNQRHVVLAGQPLATLVLIDYLDRFGAHQLGFWSRRKTSREYGLNLSRVVAKALHQEMQASLLTPYQQVILAKLDQALVNYRSPSQWPGPVEAGAELAGGGGGRPGISPG